jgi:hypothetical protein
MDLAVDEEHVSDTSGLQPCCSQRFGRPDCGGERSVVAHVVQGRLSHLEEPMWHFQKYLATRIEQAHPQ